MLGYTRIDYDYDALADLAAGRVEKLFEKIDRFDSARDLPWSLAYAHFARRYPDARFILTLRSDPEMWLQSLRKHNLRWDPLTYHPIEQEERERRPSTMFDILGYDDRREIYHRHVTAVQECFASEPERLLTLCWENGDGWPELCRFLGEAVPDGVAFPRENVHGAVTPRPAKVFGVGLGGSGLQALRFGLSHLGHSCLDFDLECLADYAEGRHEQLARTLEAFDGGVNCPWMMAYPVLARRFPDAKFVLTERGSAADWVRTSERYANMANKTELQRKTDAYTAACYARMDVQADGPESFYQWHNDGVRAFFADEPGRLLTVSWDRGAGWGELCGFLGMAVPQDKPFPYHPDFPE